MVADGRAEMVQTPWGRADQLRERMLRPGPGVPREEVAQSQRERLFAAMVGSVSTKEFEATTIADLLELSGVSRSTFYEHFRDKEDCLLATFDALVDKSMELVSDALDSKGTGQARTHSAFEGQLQKITQQPAAARLCFCDIYTAGERGRVAVERSMVTFTAVAGQAIAEIHDDRKLPDDMVHGVIGGVQTVIQAHLRCNTERALPDLAGDLLDWALGYEPPEMPLRLAGRRLPSLNGHPSPMVAYSQAERIIRALAADAGERGYPAVTIAEIAARASVSQATFYSHFADKEAVLLAALDSAGSQMLGMAMPAARRAPDWPSAIRAAIGGLCAFYAAEPDLARLAAVEIYAAGPTALIQRDRGFDQIRMLLEPAFKAAPETKSVVADAVLGTVWTLLYTQIVTTSPQSLPQVAPLATYMVLAPFVGAAEAAMVANGDGRRHAL